MTAPATHRVRLQGASSYPPRACPPPREASSVGTPGGRIAKRSIPTPSAYYAVYTQGGKSGQIVYTVGGAA